MGFVETNSPDNPTKTEVSGEFAGVCRLPVDERYMDKS